MVAIEVIHFMKTKTRGNEGCVTLKFDISKTYDHMNLDYLKGVMDTLNDHGYRNS